MKLWPFIMDLISAMRGIASEPQARMNCCHFHQVESQATRSPQTPALPQSSPARPLSLAGGKAPEAMTDQPPYTYRGTTSKPDDPYPPRPRAQRISHSCYIWREQKRPQSEEMSPKKQATVFICVQTKMTRINHQRSHVNIDSRWLLASRRMHS